MCVDYRMKGDTTSKLEMRGRDRRRCSEGEWKRRMSLIDWREVFDTENVDVANLKF